MKNLFVSLVMLFTLSAQAAVLETVVGNGKIAGVGISVSGTTSVDGNPVALTTVASGLRKKYLIGPIGTDIYVAQVLVDTPSAYTKSGEEFVTLESLANTSVVAFKMDFVYGLSNDQVYNAFLEALSLNEVDLTNPEVAAFLAAIQNGGNADVGTSLSIVLAKKADGTEVLTVEDPAGVATAINGTSGLTQKIMSIWLGKISDSDKGLQKLKEQLTQ